MKKIISDFFLEEINDSLLYQYDDVDFSKLMLNEHLDDSSFGASRARYFIKREARFLDMLLRDLGVFTILDVGCGPGFYTEEFNQLGYRCDGIDMSPSVIEYAKNHIPNSEFFCCKIQELQIDKRYDSALLLFGLLNEIEDADALISSVACKVKEGGYIVLEVMRPEFYDGLMDNALNVTQRTKPSCFSQNPHIRITKRFVVEERKCLVNRNLVFENNGNVSLKESHFFGYDNEEMKKLLEKHGFMDVQCTKGIDEGLYEYESFYHYIIAKKRSLG